MIIGDVGLGIRCVGENGYTFYGKRPGRGFRVFAGLCKRHGPSGKREKAAGKGVAARARTNRIVEVGAPRVGCFGKD